MSIDRAYELLQQAANLPHGVEKVEIVEEAVRLCDAAGDEAYAFYARGQLIDAGNWSGMF